MHSSASALWYLRLTSLRNLLVARIKRLKQPKYLFGAIAGIAYFYFLVFRRFSYPRTASSATEALPSSIHDLYFSSLAIKGSLLLTLYLLQYWIWPRARAALTFSEAEIAFLFSAPISRQTLIHYRMGALMSGTLLGALIFALFSANSGLLPGNALMRFIGCWIILTTIGLHAIASSFVITRLLDRGVTTLRRQLSAAAIIVAVIAVLGIWTWRAMQAPNASDVENLDTIKNYFFGLFSTAPLSWLLLPAKMIVMPALAPNAMAFTVALIPAAGVIWLHYIWVLHSQVAFEEASIVKAQKRATKLAEMRVGKVRFGNSKPKAKPTPFNLNLIRRPEIAFLWKNLLATAPYLNVRNFFIAALLIVIGCQWITNGQHEILRSMIQVIGGVFAGYMLLLGPMIARQDLRSDLPNTDILKTYPLRGWQVMLGEVLTPVTVLSALFCLLILAASLTLRTDKIQWMTPTIHWGGTIALTLLGILLCTMQVMMLNAAALLFPAWMQNNQGGPAGVEVMGQRILFAAGLMLVFAIMLLPAALIAGLVYLLTQLLAGKLIAITLAIIVLIAIMTVEVVFGFEWLGEKFEQFDLSAELRA